MDNTNRMFFEAIALKRCIVAVYNRMRVKLAPHILYTRHGDMFVDAVTLQRDGLPPRELKLGTFKLTGLKDPELIEDGFAPDPQFNPADEKYDGVTLFLVDRL